MKYIIFSVTHAHADNVDKLLLLLFELAAYLQRMMLKNGRGGREWGWGGEGAIDVGAKVLLVVVIAQSSTIVVAALLCLCLLCALRYARHISLSLCLSISLFPTLSSSLSLAVLLLCALQKRFYLFTAVFMYRELRIRKCKATQNMWALACIHMFVCTQGTCTYIYIYISVSVSPLYLTRVVRWRNAHENSRSSRQTAFLELRICHLRAAYSYHTHSYTRTHISS